MCPKMRLRKRPPKQLHDLALVYLRDFIHQLAGEKVLALFLEDVHWADTSSLDTLGYLFHQLSNMKLLGGGLGSPRTVRPTP